MRDEDYQECDICWALVVQYMLTAHREWHQELEARITLAADGCVQVRKDRNVVWSPSDED